MAYSTFTASSPPGTSISTVPTAELEAALRNMIASTASGNEPNLCENDNPVKSDLQPPHQKSLDRNDGDTKHARSYSNLETAPPSFSAQRYSAPPSLNKSYSFSQFLVDKEQRKKDKLKKQAAQISGVTRNLAKKGSASSLRSVFYTTATTETLSRRMSCQPYGGESSPTATRRANTSPVFEFGDNSEKGANSSRSVSEEPIESTDTDDITVKSTVYNSRPTSSSRISLSSLSSERSYVHNSALISNLPEIPSIAPPNPDAKAQDITVGGPVGGSTHVNPHNYISHPAYKEDTTDITKHLTDELKRTANSSIHSLFDPIFPIAGLDGLIPEGFPSDGFGMREMKRDNLKGVLEAYGLHMMEGKGYAVDRENMSRICQYIGASWLENVI